MEKAQVSGEQALNLGSENITNEILLKLARRVNTLLAQPDIAGVVITHGTETLEETAYFLNLVVKSDKPVRRPESSPDRQLRLNGCRADWQSKFA
ncbi:MULTISPECIES: asparaginase domain-containing protein [Paraburkholderia]|uniref:asparaginase domain-containing protein n=1 Tax=Paraburkholderia TaxID=1822464 RepID=UPI0038BBFE36